MCCVSFLLRDACSASAVLLSVHPPSVCPSVCLSVTLTYCEHIGWTSSKLITLTISLRSSLIGAKTLEHWQPIPTGTPLKFGWNKGGVALLSKKPAISLKRGKIGPRLLLMTSRKSYTCFRLMPKSTTLDDPEGPLRTVSKHMRKFK